MTKPILVILAAGLGSRYGSLKQLEPIGPDGEAIIDYSVFDAIRAGFGKVVFVIKKDLEKDFQESLLRRFQDKVDTTYVFQELDMLPAGYALPPDRIKPWGTAHAMLAAKEAVDSPFCVINADDFYGYEAFSEMCSYLSSADTQNEYSMVGYKLINTLSEHGTVSRGVCKMDENHYLKSVTELTQIARENSKIVYYNEGETGILPQDAIVSMNFWGFGSSVFTHTEQQFSAFLDDHIQDPKAEFYIPVLVDQLISEGTVRVKVLQCNAKWFGITYKEDREAARAGILEKIEAGAYPRKLWK